MTGDERPVALAAVIVVGLMLLVIILPVPDIDQGEILPRKTIGSQYVDNALAPPPEERARTPTDQEWQQQAMSQQEAWEEQGLSEDAIVQNVAQLYLPAREKDLKKDITDREEALHGAEKKEDVAENATSVFESEAPTTEEALYETESVTNAGDTTPAGIVTVGPTPEIDYKNLRRNLAAQAVLNTNVDPSAYLPEP
ncbi:MAG: hypothetical protein QGG26_11475 [Candidatus Undinarchaeales archaeon]|nr:hypothetical protein [Candidatus Undinarchaeales archaeon]